MRTHILDNGVISKVELSRDGEIYMPYFVITRGNFNDGEYWNEFLSHLASFDIEIAKENMKKLRKRIEGKYL